MYHCVESCYIICNVQILFVFPVADEKITASGPIEPDKSSAEIRQEPYSLPEGFQWDTLVLDDPLVLKELYTLLTENYVEDDDAMFRFDYPPQFLKWLVNYRDIVLTEVLPSSPCCCLSWNLMFPQESFPSNVRNGVCLKLVDSVHMVTFGRYITFSGPSSLQDGGKNGTVVSG